MPELYAPSGRVLGRLGIRTRSAVLAAVARHLEVTPWHRASVPAVARMCGTSTATFYQYFADLPAAVRELAAGDQAPEHVRRIVGLLAWEDSNLEAVDRA